MKMFHKKLYNNWYTFYPETNGNNFKCFKCVRGKLNDF